MLQCSPFDCLHKAFRSDNQKGNCNRSSLNLEELLVTLREGSFHKIRTIYFVFVLTGTYLFIDRAFIVLAGNLLESITTVIS